MEPAGQVIPPKQSEETGPEQAVPEAKPETENVDVKLSADIFPNKEQVYFRSELQGVFKLRFC